MTLVSDVILSKVHDNYCRVYQEVLSRSVKPLTFNDGKFESKSAKKNALKRATFEYTSLAINTKGEEWDNQTRNL